MLPRGNAFLTPIQVKRCEYGFPRKTMGTRGAPAKIQFYFQFLHMCLKCWG